MLPISIIIKSLREHFNPNVYFMKFDHSLFAWTMPIRQVYQIEIAHIATSISSPQRCVSSDYWIEYCTFWHSQTVAISIHTTKLLMSYHYMHRNVLRTKCIIFKVVTVEVFLIIFWNKLWTISSGCYRFKEKRWRAEMNCSYPMTSLFMQNNV